MVSIGPSGCLESRIASPAGTQANSTQPASPPLKLLLRQLIKPHSRAVAILAINSTESRGLSASRNSSTVMAL